MLGSVEEEIVNLAIRSQHLLQQETAVKKRGSFSRLWLSRKGRHPSLRHRCNSLKLRIRIKAFCLIQVLKKQSWTEILHKNSIFRIKKCYLAHPKEEKPTAFRREHPAVKMCIFIIFFFEVHFCLPKSVSWFGVRIRVDAESNQDPQYWTYPDQIKTRIE